MTLLLGINKTRWFAYFQTCLILVLEKQKKQKDCHMQILWSSKQTQPWDCWFSEKRPEIEHQHGCSLPFSPVRANQQTSRIKAVTACSQQQTKNRQCIFISPLQLSCNVSSADVPALRQTSLVWLSETQRWDSGPVYTQIYEECGSIVTRTGVNCPESRKAPLSLL